jgi:hypothetical protein
VFELEPIQHVIDPRSRIAAAPFCGVLRVSRDGEHGFHCIVSTDFAGS